MNLPTRYLVAATAPVVAALLILVTWPFFEDSPLALFIIVVTVAAWYGGLKPGLLSLVLSFVLAEFIFVRFFSSLFARQGDIVYLITLLAIGISTSVLSELLHRAKSRAEENLSSIQLAEFKAKQMAAIVQTSSDAIISKNLDGIVESWNQGAVEMFSYTADEMIGQSVMRLIPEQYQHDEEMLLSRIARGERVQHFETQRIRKDGTLIDVDLSVSPILNSEGKVVGASKVLRDITNRKQVEQALKTSEERLRLAIAATKLGTWQLDIKTRQRTWSAKSRKLFGLGPEVELTDEYILPLIHPDDFERLQQALSDALLPGSKRELHLEFRIVREPEKEIRWIESQGHVLYENGEPMRVIGTMLDITDRKVAEQALQQERRLLRTLIDMLPDYVYLKDTESKFLACNKACAHLMAMSSPSELFGKTDADFYPAELAEQFRADEVKVLAGTPLYNKEENFTRPDGTPNILLTTKLPIRNSNGEVTGLVGYGRNITAEREAEKARLTSEARLDFALQTSKIGAWQMRLSDRTISRTLIHDQIFGYHDLLPEWTYETALDHVLPEDRADVDRSFHEALATKTTWNLEFRIRRADGEIRWIWSAGGQELNSEGKPERVSGIIQDISSRKKTEEEIRKLNESLEQRVEERTAQLQTAVKELEAFSYSVSHDLRAPLRHINGFSNALLEDYGDQLDDVGRGYLNEIRGASKEMGQLIDDVLNLAYVTRSQMHHESVNLTEMSRRVFADLVKHNPERQVQFRAQDGLIVTGDRRLLRIVMLNLLGNALKFSSRKPRAEIEFGSREAQGQLTYFVRDNGAGFDMAYVGKLFSAFQRLHTVTEFEGTGIGLATVQRIIHRHGGRVWAEGVVGVGATIYFTLGHQTDRLDANRRLGRLSTN